MNLKLPSNYLDPVPVVDVLAILPHPTQAELSVGGTLLRLAAEGYRTGVLDLTPGDVTLRGRLEEILDSAEAAAGLLGLTWRGNLHYPDGRMDNSLPGRMTIAGEIRRLQPRLLILPCADERHPDFRATAEMGEQACEMAALERLDPETPAHRVSTVIYVGGEKPSFVVDVTEQWERKAAALAAYASESGGDGAAVERRRTEGFRMRGPLRLDDFGALGLR
jgi:N-acetylglucosamine malate deacetylase 1